MILRDGSSVSDPRLDRLPEFDDRSRRYGICAALPPHQSQKPVSKRWSIPYGSPVLDQGQQGACTGFGVTNDLRFYPVAVRGLTDTFARETIYWGAQRIDVWPGGSYPGATPTYEGSSVLAAVRTAADLGYYGEYRWAFSEPEMALGVGHLGPVIIGVNWYEGMMRPDNTGYLHVTGDTVGGHCILVIGLSVHYGYYVVYNSWGPAWGANGLAKISRADMARLLAEKGECCLVTDRLRPTR